MSSIDLYTETYKDLSEADKQKLDKFLPLYLNKNSETYSNATRSAIKAFNLDPDRQYNYAMFLGSSLMKKARLHARDIMDNSNATLAYMVNFALLEMKEAKDTNKRRMWWRELMELAGYKKEAALINIFNQTNNTVNVNVISEEERKKFNDNFIKFINSGGEVP
jgi:inorganic triphosphatase YgiF